MISKRWQHLLIEPIPARDHIVHGAHQADRTLVDHLAHDSTPVAKLLHCELDIHLNQDFQFMFSAKKWKSALSISPV
jgi:hypothetical protein